MSLIPDSHLDLLTRPLCGHLATRRDDGSLQVTPMWFSYDGTDLSFTTTSTRRKYRNLEQDPHLSVSINDPDQPYRYLEVRGVVAGIDPDPTGAFFDTLARRYGLPYDPPVADAADRVVIRMRPTAISKQ
ncbi:PPOX class F420-dependent oxidoreductase [Millisia brevis]|uniref:PPOX class F420-dependent oxidoreductase n=1 Tax=Millisia brevis TaxID=264148 RepID=UPI00082B9F94|nr:PPOX class F420-dependent oxidoreductase [Millisia brevis]